MPRSSLRQSEAWRSRSFDPQGTIQDANKNFLNAVGYSLQEIKGKHHSMFLRPRERNSADYALFWEELAKGRPQSGDFPRLTKSADLIWLTADYTPVADELDGVGSVVETCRVVTDEHNRNNEMAAIMTGLDRSTAIIEFEPDGTIIRANQNLLSAMGYSLSEIRGRHHRIFVSAELSQSDDYTRFWAALAKGEHQQGEYPRVSKTGGNVWISATYNPVLDGDGNVSKVVKFANDITPQRTAFEQLSGSLMKLGNGDTSVRIDASIGDEFAAVRDSFNQTASQFEYILGGISTAGASVSVVSDTLRDQSATLAQRSEAQSASLTETRTAVA
jgi:methyl-accepting chemotaxis protein